MDISSKIVVITGANSGLGFETAKYFVSTGNLVVMAVRDVNKGEISKKELLGLFPDGKIDVLYLDLAKLKSVYQFAEAFSQKYNSIDLLINNAGVMIPPYSRTEEGFELQFGCNHLGHFALTGLLLPLLEQGEHPRVVTLSSIAHRNGVIDFNNLDGSKGYKAMKFYSQSKLANLLFAKELDERLKRNGYKTISLAAHPGIS
ncbi:MAG: short-chain dehydrogenase/reductase, partial [Bacillus sp. (in: firmicutes)]|nr:short-chain dehydrogenase/reductase [Bacillus sp. (in: firmicutes)]